MSAPTPRAVTSPSTSDPTSELSNRLGALGFEEPYPSQFALAQAQAQAQAQIQTHGHAQVQPSLPGVQAQPQAQRQLAIANVNPNLHMAQQAFNNQTPYAFDGQYQYMFDGGPYSPIQATAQQAATYPYDMQAPMTPAMANLSMGVGLGLGLPGYDAYSGAPGMDYGVQNIQTPEHQRSQNQHGQNMYPTPDSTKNGSVYRPPHIHGRPGQSQQQAHQQQSQTQHSQQHQSSAPNSAQQAAMAQQGAMGYFSYGDQRQHQWAPQPGIYGQQGGHVDQHKPGRGRRNNTASSTPHTPSQRGGNQQTPYTPPGQDMIAQASLYGMQTPMSPAYAGAYGIHQLQASLPHSSSFSPHMGGYGQHRARKGDDNVHGITRSAKLEEFRHAKPRRTDVQLTEIFGYIVEFSGDQHGSRLIQNKLESASAEDKQKVFDEIMPNAYQLMTDVFGNYVIQKMFEHGDQLQKAALAKKMEGKVLDLSMQMYGCRVVQKALEHILVDQRNKLVAELDGHYIECIKSSNANHVVQRLIALDPPQSLITAFIGSVNELSTHPFGCRVLQKSVETLESSRLRALLDELHTCSNSLMEDQFGNYVIQSVIEQGPAADRAKLVDVMRGRINELCRHKFASNVVEKVLKYGTDEEKREVVVELIGYDSATDSNKIGQLLRDPYGNFPVQTALSEAKAEQRDELLDIIVPLMPQLRHTPCGRRLEIKISELDTKSFTDAVPDVIRMEVGGGGAVPTMGLGDDRGDAEDAASEDAVSTVAAFAAVAAGTATPSANGVAKKDAKEVKDSKVAGVNGEAKRSPSPHPTLEDLLH